MGTKTISIMNDVYDLLKKNKISNESFSDTLRRILSKEKHDIRKFAGTLKNCDLTETKATIAKLRSKTAEELSK